MSRPRSFTELRAFYINEFRPLYDKYAATGEMAQELHAETAAAFDHLMRNNIDAAHELSPNDCDRVAGHLKRATFDAFKLFLDRKIRKPYELLMDERFADVEDGNFQIRITRKWNEAQKIAEHARSHERLSDAVDVDEWHRAFEEWRKILPIVDFFENEISSKKVIRAKGKHRIGKIKRVIGWIISAVLGAIISAVIGKYI